MKTEEKTKPSTSSLSSDNKLQPELSAPQHGFSLARWSTLGKNLVEMIIFDPNHSIRHNFRLDRTAMRSPEMVSRRSWTKDNGCKGYC